MARPWRVQYEGAIYHVMSRGVAQGKIFLIDEDYHRFLECLERISEKFRLEIFAFVLMGNHYHLLLRTKEANLSRAMQWLQTSYSLYHNRKHNRSGHLFQGRFFSSALDEKYLWAATPYAERKPVRAESAERAEDYAWNGAAGHCGIKEDKIYHWIFHFLGS